jgi:RNA polymerase sigma-70 factor (ECF subfamily)
MEQEKQLVERIVSGDLGAFQQFIEEYQRLVTHMVFRMVLNEADREEICQDVFLKIYQNLKNFQFQSKLSTWISKISYNTCINYLKKKKALLYDDFALHENGSFDSSPENKQNGSLSLKGELPLPDEAAISSEISEMLYRELNQLPVHYRTIITLYHLDDLNYEEISEITGLPMGTVKSHLFRARKLLKDKLLQKYEKQELVQ